MACFFAREELSYKTCPSLPPQCNEWWPKVSQSPTKTTTTFSSTSSSATTTTTTTTTKYARLLLIHFLGPFPSRNQLYKTVVECRKRITEWPHHLWFRNRPPPPIPLRWLRNAKWNGMIALNWKRDAPTHSKPHQVTFCVISVPQVTPLYFLVPTSPTVKYAWGNSLVGIRTMCDNGILSRSGGGGGLN